VTVQESDFAHDLSGLDHIQNHFPAILGDGAYPDPATQQLIEEVDVYAAELFAKIVHGR